MRQSSLSRSVPSSASEEPELARCRFECPAAAVVDRARLTPVDFADSGLSFTAPLGDPLLEKEKRLAGFPFDFTINKAWLLCRLF